jgi:hypothetical protein
MKNKGLLALILGALAVGFGSTAESTPQGIDFARVKVTKPTSKHGLRLPDRTPKDGGGPMIPPGTN